MAQLRQQFLRQQAVTLAATATTIFDVVGPETALASPYAEGTDHVTNPRQVRQNESGWVNIEITAGLLTANTTYTVEIWKKASTAAQKGLDTALFPSGAAAAADPSLQRVVVSSVLGNSVGLDDLLGGPLATPVGPGLHLRADEFVRFTVVNASTALGPLMVTSKFDLGLNPNDSRRS